MAKYARARSLSGTANRACEVSLTKVSIRPIMKSPHLLVSQSAMLDENYARGYTCRRDT